jgi:hypothetical protein
MTIALLIALIAVVLGCTLHLAKKITDIAAQASELQMHAVLHGQFLLDQDKREKKRDEIRKTLFTGEGRQALRQRLRERQEQAAKG